LNLGVGLSDSGIPVYIGFDHSVSQDITLGAELSYRAYNEHWQNDYYNHNIVGISGNANYHLIICSVFHHAGIYMQALISAFIFGIHPMNIPEATVQA